MVMMVVVFLQYRVVRRMFLAVDVLPDGFLVFVDATAMC